MLSAWVAVDALASVTGTLKVKVKLLVQRPAHLSRGKLLESVWLGVAIYFTESLTGGLE